MERFFSEPDLEGWTQGVEAILSAIEAGTLGKAVLSRRLRLDLNTSPDAFAMLAQMQTPDETFDFCFEPVAGRAFLGRSPEQLFVRQGERLKSEALAGTRPRDIQPQRDDALGEEMLNSPKERSEHHHVVEAIEDALRPLCVKLHHPETPRLRRFAAVQHLQTPFTVVLRPGVRTETLLNVLHPTPAVCGQPREVARRMISVQEPFSRGWYAGPVGWVEGDSASFAVGIRSSLLVDEKLWVCAGAGIVAGSKPDAEWEEINIKSTGFLKRFSAEAS